MIKRTILFISVIVFAFTIILSYNMELSSSNQDIFDVDNIMLCSTYEESYVIYPFPVSDGYAVVIPAYWNNRDIYVKLPESYTLESECIDKNGKLLEAMEEGKKYKAVLSNSEENINISSSLTFYKSSISTCMINTESGSMDFINKNKDNKESGTIIVTSESGEKEYDGQLEWIHGRGNSTWLDIKKPYNIKLKKESSLLGLKADEKFCLLANGFDSSMLRNWLAYRIAEDIKALSPGGSFTALYLNGQYYGVYMLTNKIGISRNMINIEDLEKNTESINNIKKHKRVYTDNINGVEVKGYSNYRNPDDITGGYVLNIGQAGLSDSGFTTKRNIAVNIDSPQYATREQVQYISEFFQEIEDALNESDGINPVTGKHYSEYLDIDSFAKMYLIEEVFLDQDVNVASMPMYKDCDKNDPKLYAGPVWDFDLSVNNYTGPRDMSLPNIGNTLLAASPMNNYEGILCLLAKHDDFMEVVKKIYSNNVTEAVNKYVFGVEKDKIKSQIQKDFALNNIRWYPDKNIDFNEEYKKIEKFFEDRLHFLNSVWSDEQDYVSVQLWLTGEPPHYHAPKYMLKKGEVYTPPEYTADNKVFLGWYYKDTDIPFISGTAINDDTELEIHWNDIEPEKNIYSFIKEHMISILYYVPYVLFLLILAGLIIIALKRRNK